MAYLRPTLDDYEWVDDYGQDMGYPDVDQSGQYTPPNAGFAPPPPQDTYTPPPPMPTTRPDAPPPSTPAPTAYNTTGWDTDSYGIPGYIASNFGSAPSGWDPAKWNDPMHQTPKYVWGRIYQEARNSGDPNWQQNAINNFLKAYPGTQYNGRDVIYTPWGEQVDIFTDYGTDPRSTNGISWNVFDPNAQQGGGFDLNGILSSLGSRSYSGPVDPSKWSLADFNSGTMECNGMSGQACVDFYNQWRPKSAAPNGGGTASGGTTATSGPQAPNGGMQALYDVIGRMLEKSGDYNQDILNRRIESAREQMNRARSSQTDLIRSQLSQRGLLGQGPETTAMTGLEEQLGDIYGGQVRDIYADESARADERLLQTMGIAAGLSGDDAQRLVDWFNAQTGRDVGMGQIAATNRRTDADAAAEAGKLGLGYSQLDLDRLLGQGNLALGNLSEMNRYNLGLGDLGLRRDIAGYDVQHNQLGDMLEIIKLMNPNLYQSIPPQYRG